MYLSSSMLHVKFDLLFLSTFHNCLMCYYLFVCTLCYYVCVTILLMYLHVLLCFLCTCVLLFCLCTYHMCYYFVYAPVICVTILSMPLLYVIILSSILYYISSECTFLGPSEATVCLLKKDLFSNDR